MNQARKTKAQLLEELGELQRRVGELAASEQRWRAVFETAQDSIFIKNRGLEYTHVNPAMERLFGLAAEQLVGRTDEDLFGEDAGAHTRAADARVLGGETVEEEHAKPVHGALRTFHVIKVPMRNSSGEIIGLCGIARDVTEPKRAEEALRESEEQLRLITDSLPVLISYVDSEQRYRFNNRSYEEWFGVSRTEAAGRHLREVLGDQVYQRIRPYVEAALSGREVTFENEVPYKDAGTRYVSVTYVPHFDRDAQVRGFFALVADISERKRAEEALRESEEQLRLITDSLPVLISYVDSEQRYRFNNRSYEEWFGVSRTETAGRHLREVLGDQAYQTIRPYVEAALSGREVTFENEVPYKDAGTRYVSATYVPHLDRDAQVRGFFALVADISERKRAEEALRESEARYRQLFATVSDAIIVFEAETFQFVDVNDAALKLYGYSKEEFLKLRHLDITAEREQSIDSIRQALAGQLARIPLRYHKKKDGTIFPVEISANTLTMGDRRLLCGVIRDITQRKRAEDELRKFKTISDQANYGAAISDLDGCLLYVNNAFAEMHGYAPEELIGKDLSVLHTREQMTHVKPLNDALKREGSFNAEEVWHKRRDGCVFPTLMNATVITDENGTPMFLSATAIDITEHKQAEDEKARLTEQLQQAQKMQAVGQVTAGIAHDFGNLLAVARNAVARLRKTATPSKKVRQTLEVIEEAVEEATSKTQSLLMFSRRLPAERAPLKVDKLVEDSTHILRHLLPATVELRLDARCDQPCWIDGDPGQLQQVLLNLTLNARDAMPDGGTLAISCGSDRDDRPDAAAQEEFPTARAVRLTVRDTGVGIAPEVLGRVFEPFFTTKSAGRGTGLGLAVVQSIVRDHGGQIEVQSELGAGTTVTVTLPGISFAPATGAAGRPEAVPAGRGALILLDEDNRHIRRLITATLRTWDYQVLAPASGSSAAETYQRQAERIALLILNGDPPKRRGFELVRQMRAAGRRTPAVVTVRSGDAEVEDQVDRDTVLLEKPFQMSELGACLGKLLTGRPAPGSG